MQRYTTIITLLVLFLAQLPARAQGFLRADGTDIVDESGEPYLLRGMGLGGYMVQEGYMMQTTDVAPTQHELRALITELIGEEDTEAWYQAWRDNYLQESDVELMHRQGFNSIRLPMHYNLYTLPIEQEPTPGQQTWLEEGFTRTDSLIAWCKARGMYLILDLHAAPGGQGMDRPISDRNPDLPSLWDSPANRDKSVALWRRLAERYADEPTVGGFDLLNEVNWELPGGEALRDLYGRMTDTIRAVDQNHLLFIEGNWFANDFTGLTPPWDDNMAYSPHKYWSLNTDEEIQFALDLRNDTGRPLYLGETGENSNHWFREAVQLYENNNMGWAWWPWKKMESVVGPINSPMDDGYRQLIEYWKGEAPQPSAEDARAALMRQAQNMRLENSTVQKGVIDALFRQVTSAEAIPFADSIDIPGVLLSTNYDLGRVGIAYVDEMDATYHVNTNEYTTWNNGWSYRNDGVDIESNQDDQLTNGYNVGWTADDEWMRYTVRVAEDGLYRVRIRAASNNPGGGSISLRTGNINLTGVTPVPNTGGWQTWQDVVVEGMPLLTTDDYLHIYIDGGGFNLGGLEFIKTADLATATTEFLDAGTLGSDTVRLTLNRPLLTTPGLNVEDFVLTADGDGVALTTAIYDPAEARSLLLVTARALTFGEELLLRYRGDAVTAPGDFPLSLFEDREVTNNLPAPPVAYAIPGTLEAEDYFRMEGVRLETNIDMGGSQNVAFLDPGDFMDYYVEVAEAGMYGIDYRTASNGFTGGLTLQLIGEDGEAEDLQTVTFESTGGWQTWAWTTAPAVTLPAGRQQLRMVITAPSFNLNLLEFSALTSTSTSEAGHPLALQLSPNPTDGVAFLRGELPEAERLTGHLFTTEGRLVRTYAFGQVTTIATRLDLGDLPGGAYRLIVRGDGGGLFSGLLIRR